MLVGPPGVAALGHITHMTNEVVLAHGPEQKPLLQAWLDQKQPLTVRTEATLNLAAKVKHYAVLENSIISAMEKKYAHRVETVIERRRFLRQGVCHRLQGVQGDIEKLRTELGHQKEQLKGEWPFLDRVSAWKGFHLCSNPTHDRYHQALEDIEDMERVLSHCEVLIGASHYAATRNAGHIFKNLPSMLC